MVSIRFGLAGSQFLNSLPLKNPLRLFVVVPVRIPVAGTEMRQEVNERRSIINRLVDGRNFQACISILQQREIANGAWSRRDS
jgi:hypothetical protein